MISFADFEDIPALKKIWSDCFHDPEDYIDFYFMSGFKPENTLVYRENGQLCAMVTLLPGFLRMEYKRKVLPVYYIYAAATSPERQGRGIMKKLLSFAEEYAKSQGIQALTLVPGSASLFEYYQKLGYSTVFFYFQAAFSGKELARLPACPVTDQLDFDRFFQMREEFLSGFSASFFWEREELTYIYREAEKTGGKLLNFCHNGLQGYAICYKIGNDVIIKEAGTSVLALRPFLAGIHRYFNAENYFVRLYMRESSDFSEGQAVPFGMIKILASDMSVSSTDFSDAYMGLMLD